MRRYISSVLFLTVVILFDSCTPIGNPGPVSANIIYTHYGRAIPIGGTTLPSVFIDINNDSINDFEFRNFGCVTVLGGNNITPLANCEISATDSACFGLIAYNVNDTIKSNRPWKNGSAAIQGIGASPFQPVLNVFTGTVASDLSIYLGARIKNGSGYNYAWLRVKVMDGSIGTRTYIVESAYDKNINEQILAGKK